MLFNIIIIIIVVYVLLFLLIALSLGSKYKKNTFDVPIPETMAKAIRDLKTKHEDNYRFLEAALDLVKERFKSGRVSILFKPKKLFTKDIDFIWNQKGLQICSSQNKILAFILVRSLKFKPEEIKRGTTWVNFSIHQFLKIRIGENIVKADPWGADYNVEIGNNAHGFV